MINTKEAIFYSPTYGQISLERVFEIIENFVKKDPSKEYEIVVGADSQTFTNRTKFVLVIAVHCKGSGGIFFYYLEYLNKMKNLQLKIHHEVQMSIEVAGLVLEKTLQLNLPNLIFNHIDVDIGTDGETKRYIKEIVGWVTGVLGVEGISVRIKPNAPIASCVADKISK